MLDDADIFVEVVERPRRAYVPLPDMQILDGPGWIQLITPSFHEGGFNEVAHAVLDEADADRVIAETIADYRRRGIRFRWTVGPGSAPADLADRLARTGLVRTESFGMARRIDPATDLVAVHRAGIAISRVDASNLDAFTATNAEGWSRDPAPFHVAHAAMLASGWQHMFVATCDGEPAGAAATVEFPRSAYLLGAVVREPFRGRGVYRALVDARLADAAARGLTLATTHAIAETSAPILERLGFTTVCQFSSFRG